MDDLRRDALSVRLGACLLLGACGPSVPAPTVSSADASALPDSPKSAPLAPESVVSTPESTPPGEGQAIVLIDGAESLARLAPVGDFGGLVYGMPQSTTKALRASAEYRELVVSLELGGRGGMAFPRWWVGHPRTSFELVGVVNRLDRRDARPGTCGETRFVHRLAYRGDDESVRFLPMALNVVLRQDDDGEGCRRVARSWVVPVGADPIEVLTGHGGPLHADQLTREHLLAIESNIRTSEGWDAPGGGSNELRVHSFEEQARPGALEFEPYSKNLLVSGSVVRWLMKPGTFESIERGVATMPKNWEWDEGSVYLSGGESRYGVFGTMWKRIGKDDPRLTLPDEGLLSTRDGLTHRLDGMSCSGCHSRRSVAGFHLPGDVDDLRGGASAHLLSDLDWRTAYVEAVAQGRAPDDRRRLSDDGPPGFARRCSLEDSPVSSFRCDAGFTCVEASGFQFGTCLPDEYRGPAPCHEGDEGCRRPSAWFPAGFRVEACEDGQPCAAIPRPADARRCRGTADPWACALRQADRVVVDRCEVQSECREGYVCVDQEQEGICRPAATVPGLRILGHRARLQ